MYACHHCCVTHIELRALPVTPEEVKACHAEFDVTACIMALDPNAACHHTHAPNHHDYYTSKN